VRRNIGVGLGLCVGFRFKSRLLILNEGIGLGINKTHHDLIPLIFMNGNNNKSKM